MADPIAVPVRTGRQRRQFTQFAKDLYADCPQWVPPMDADMRKVLSRKHPYFHHSEGEFFLICRGNLVTGRVMVTNNPRYNEEHGLAAAHFYFADFVDDPEVSSTLFNAVADWAATRHLTTLIGPLFSGATMGGGVLVSGFENRAAMTMMPYNYPHYEGHYLASGFSKRFDLNSLWADPSRFTLPERVQNVAERVRSRGRFTVVPVANRRELRKLADEMADLYNPTLADHSENYPLTDQELATLKSDLLVIARPDLEKFIRYDGKLVGFILAFPDLTEVLQKNRGKLGPLRILRLLRARRTATRVIFNGMGILEEYQRLGGNALLYSELAKSVLGENGPLFESSEMVQINEQTDLMLKDMKTVRAVPFKLHRVYQRATS